MPRLPCVGGPADGARVAETSAPFRWVDWQAERGYAERRSGTALYRKRRRRYEFVGHDATVCAGCGAIVDRGVLRLLADCPLCGAPLGGP